MCSFFTFKPFHCFYLGVSTMLKECVLSFQSSGSMLTNESGGRAGPKPLVQIINEVL